MLARCETVDLAFGEVLHVSGESIRHVYFPRECCISLIMPMHGGASLEVGLIGNEGMFGVPLALDADRSLRSGVVQGAGIALRMGAAPFRQELAHSKALHRQINRYVFVHLIQVARTVGCTRFHVIEARLARWLLMTQDRSHTSSFRITQEFLAAMLGVRRVGVTRAAGLLQKSGFIRYSRGNITVLDRRGLKGASCPCYDADREEYARIFG